MRTLKIAALILATSTIAVAEKKDRLLTRTAYVSLGFKTCGHIENAYLFAVNEDGDEVSVLEGAGEVIPYGILPLRRSFVFTYFPNLVDTLPKSYIFKVKGSSREQELTKYIVLGRDKVIIYHSKGGHTFIYNGKFSFKDTDTTSVFDYGDRLEKLNYARFKKRDIRIKFPTINVVCPICTTSQ